jgi:hypothetical protein
MLVAIWHMINDQAPYRDPGVDCYSRLNPDKIKNRAIDQLTAIGYTVTVTPPTPHRPATPLNLLVRGTRQANDRAHAAPT